MFITCKCGWRDDYENFLTVMENTFSCEKCKAVWRLVTVGKAFITPAGQLIPPYRKIEVIKEGGSQESGVKRRD